MSKLATKSLVRYKEEGATMVEYALMLALIAAVGLAAITLLGTHLSHIFSQSAASL